MINNIFKPIKFLNMLIIAMYCVIYSVAFTAFDDSASNYDEDSFEKYMIKLIVVVGMAFTCAVISNWCIYKKTERVESIVCIINGIAQIAFLFYSIDTANHIYRLSLSSNDKITKFHCDAAILMVNITIVTLIIFLLCSLYGFVVSFKYRSNELEEVGDLEDIEYTDERSYHLLIIIVLFATTTLCVFYIYSVLAIWLMLPFFSAFAIPISLLLATEIKEWVEEKRYIAAAFAYVWYGYIVYGVFYRLFSDEMHGMASHYGALKLVFPGFVMLANMLIAGITAIRLIVKRMKA